MEILLSLYCLIDSTLIAPAYNDGTVTSPPFASQDDLLRQPVKTPNFAQPARDGEVEEIEELEGSVVFDMDCIQSEVLPLCCSNLLT